ncbi:MAG: hypothetical protein IJ228_03890 [Succinivibrio sp.]|nr:hypothetical protein [Succinivibrio sp.]
MDSAEAVNPGQKAATFPQTSRSYLPQTSRISEPLTEMLMDQPYGADHAFLGKILQKSHAVAAVSQDPTLTGSQTGPDPAALSPSKGRSALS